MAGLQEFVWFVQELVWVAPCSKSNRPKQSCCVKTELALEKNLSLRKEHHTNMRLLGCPNLYFLLLTGSYHL